MASHFFRDTLEERTNEIITTAAATVVEKWRSSTTPIWRVEHHGYEPTARYITVVFRNHHERITAADNGVLSEIRNDILSALHTQTTLTSRIDVYAITFTDLDADRTFLQMS